MSRRVPSQPDGAGVDARERVAGRELPEMGGDDAPILPDADPPGDPPILPSDPGPTPAPGGYGGLLYTTDRTHSPIDASVKESLRAIAAAGPSLRDDMFMKVGDSITEGYAVMTCFIGPRDNIVVDGRAHLSPVIDFFRAANAPGPSPCTEAWCRNAVTALNRKSYAARGGTTASYPLRGAPSPLQQEIAAISPRYAMVQFGTNDSTVITSVAGLPSFDAFFSEMLAITDALAQQGVVPMLYTIPPYEPPRNGHHNPPTMNAIIRAIAQGRRVPLMDYYRELTPLDDWGLWDGVHPRVEYGGCNFTSAGLRHGYNVRNLISIEALARVDAVLRQDQAPPDPAAAQLPGTGSPEDPFVIPGLPFSDLRHTDAGPTNAVASYPACGVGGTNGNDVHYRLTLGAATRVRFLALDSGTTEARVSVLQGDDPASPCLASNTLAVQLSLPAGTYRIVVDSDGGNRAGEYGLVLVPCASGDPSCS